MYVYRMGKKLEPPPKKTTFDYDLSSMYKIRCTHFLYCHQKINIINNIECKIEQLYCILLEYTVLRKYPFSVFVCDEREWGPRVSESGKII